MFDNMIAIENFDFLGERAKSGRSNNNLVHFSVAEQVSIHSWVKYNRLSLDMVSKEISKSKLKDLMIAVSFHKESEFHDAYESYVSLERAIELIKDESLFVFKFNVLPEHISNEYKMLSV